MERVEDLGETLDKIAAEADQCAVLVRFSTDRDIGQVELLVGHPVRSSLTYISPAGSRRVAVQSTLEKLQWVIQADRDGRSHPFPAAVTRLAPKTARLALAEWLSTGRRPSTHIPEWFTPGQ